MNPTADFPGCSAAVSPARRRYRSTASRNRSTARMRCPLLSALGSLGRLGDRKSVIGKPGRLAGWSCRESRCAALPPSYRHHLAAHLLLAVGPLRAGGVGVSSEPEVVELDDEVPDIPLVAPIGIADVPSPMADLPTGAKFGTLVHAVLETADPLADDLAAELRTQIDIHSVWWPVDVPTADLAAALIPMHDTPLGPLADNRTLRQIGLSDRLCEMNFEFPLAGGDLREAAPEIRLVDVGRLLGEYLPADDPLVGYAERLTDPPSVVSRCAGTSAVHSTWCCGSPTGGPPLPCRRLQDQLAR